MEVQEILTSASCFGIYSSLCQLRKYRGTVKGTPSLSRIRPWLSAQALRSRHIWGDTEWRGHTLSSRWHLALGWVHKWWIDIDQLQSEADQSCRPYHQCIEDAHASRGFNETGGQVGCHERPSSISLECRQDEQYCVWFGLSNASLHIHT